MSLQEIKQLPFRLIDTKAQFVKFPVKPAMLRERLDLTKFYTRSTRFVQVITWFRVQFGINKHE